MTQGVLLFAFNNDIVDYYEMAVATAKRVNHFLNLPVTIVTDEKSLSKTITYTFDNTILAPADTTNTRDKQLWLNKGRHRAYHLSPYDETLLLDTDYLINSDRLLTIFDLYDDFMCPNHTSFLLNPNHTQEQISTNSFNTLWATLILFKKTNRVKQMFDCLKMVEENYMHYVSLYNMVSTMYRNDYGLTIANRIVNGQLENKQDYMPDSLVHVNKEVKVYKNNDTPFNTEYTLIKERQYIIVKDIDFHMMDKKNFMELV
jgi:hypothetical protein